MKSIIIEDLFRKSGFKPNKSQEEAIKHVNGPIYLVAGPGSGKTRVLLWRTVNLIVFHNIKPEEIFLSTFTEKAAEQLKAGLITLLTLATEETGINYDISGMYVGTVHSLCQRIIGDRKLNSIKKRRKPIVLQELDQYFHIYDNKFLNGAKHITGNLNDFKEELKTYMGLRSIGKTEIIKSLTSIFNRFSEESVDINMIINNESDDELLSSLGRLYEYYLETLNKDGHERIDLSLLQQYGFNILTNSSNSEVRFKHIIIDEYQDTNSIQEAIFFKLSKGYRNICVVGDDDQSLYRFRGATVENFVQFEERCVHNINISPKKIKLNINYRSRKKIVEYYTKFIEMEDWERESKKGTYYRNMDKDIKAFSVDDGISVVTTNPGKPVDVYGDIVSKVKDMIDNNIVSDPSDIAVLFTYLKGNTNAERLKSAFEEVGIKVYAPRAARFFDNREPMSIFGLIFYVLGKVDINEEFNKGKQNEFNNWVLESYDIAENLISQDSELEKFINETINELTDLKNDYEVIHKYLVDNEVDKESLLTKNNFIKFKTVISSNLSKTGSRELNKKSLERIIDKKLKEQDDKVLKKLTFGWLINRVNSLDWNFLDLFYKFCGFNDFSKIFDDAESGNDEAPIYNLSNITKYLQFFGENYYSLITGQSIYSESLKRVFITSYLGALYKREEGDYEIKDEPIPKGRISFMTIHQSKGLEFPVVILGAIPPVKNKNNKLEEMVRPLLKGDYEPLNKISCFDRMRTYYVALSRAENLLIIPYFKGTGQSIHPCFKDDLSKNKLPLLQNLSLDSIPKVKASNNQILRVYSYTSDYLAYNDCPRKYMIYRKYNFVPARTTISFFGNLVHKTLEDMHNYFIQLKEVVNND